MEEKLIEQWLNVEVISSGAGTGAGYGYGDGNGYGSGTGSGYGDGYGYGAGSGDGSGTGDGSGSGDGTGAGYGSGDGYGYGSGWGFINNIKYYNQNRIWLIDRVPTIIKSIHGNVARGFIMNKDLTLDPTYIVKGSKLFAHGSTLIEAIQSLNGKIFDDMDLEDKIEIFKGKFNKTDKYKGTEFFTWHHNLTGSCLQGRNSFVKNNNLNLEDRYTVSEFLEIVKGSYGWGVLENLEDYYKSAKQGAENENQKTI